jgi:hypothetical protein
MVGADSASSGSRLESVNPATAKEYLGALSKLNEIHLARGMITWSDVSLRLLPISVSVSREEAEIRICIPVPAPVLTGSCVF